MSNSIWKTGYPKYEHDRCGDDIIQEYHREDGSKFYVVGSCSEPNDRWAYLTDIIAQADKAERLRKAVDLALAIYSADTSIHADKDCITMIKKAIKQLIKE